MRLVVLAALVACHGGAPIAPTASGPPRLVVLLVIDQLPEWAFEQKRPALTGGFDRLLREGAWHVGEHPSVATLTAPGHALLGTGKPPAVTGILANAWWHRDLERSLESVKDADGSVTATWLRTRGLGDAIAAQHPRAKAVSVALKDRAAVLLLGHAGTPLWLDHDRGAFVSTAPPPWLADYNRTHPLAAHLHDVWTPLAATQLVQLAKVPDERPGELGGKGFGATFPHDLGAVKDPVGAVFATPTGNDLVFDLATAAIDREQLGADDIPDYLAISLSAHDFAAHGWGHESWEVWDMTLRLDRRLGAFLAELDRKVGAGRWVMVVTSDHGASPQPKGKLSYAMIKRAANTVAEAELGPGEWIADARYPSVYLTADAVKAAGNELQVVIRKIVLALRAIPGLERVERTANVAGHCETRTGNALAICLALDVERSGDVFYMPADGYVMEDEDDPVTTAHGSIHAYDRRVPLIITGGPPHAPLAGPDGTVIPMAQIAPMLAGWLGVALGDCCR
jgi:hypothetical protein